MHELSNAERQCEKNCCHSRKYITDKVYGVIVDDRYSTALFGGFSAMYFLFGTLFVAKISEKAVRHLSSAAGLDELWKKIGVEHSFSLFIITFSLFIFFFS